MASAGGIHAPLCTCSGYREVTHFYNKNLVHVHVFNIKNLISDSKIILLTTYLVDKL